MISSFLMGRMGNNLFQIAAGLALAKKNNTNLYIPTHSWVPPNMVSCSYLNCFNLEDVNWVDNFNKVKQLLFTYSEYKFSYNEEFDSLPDNINLYGYYQSELYFKKYEECVRKNLSFTNNIIEKTKESLKTLDVNYTNATAIHVRRGDYLGLTDAHPLQNVNYYETALDKLSSDEVIVFSDDLEWCIRNFKSTHKRKYYFANMDQQTSICAMSMVSNLVIANSTFSWWGAWLNNNPNKIVYYPKKWFGSILPYENTSLEETIKDLPCREWIGI